MSSFIIKHTSIFLLLLSIYVHGEKVYTVERMIVPECKINLNNTIYIHISSETQMFGSQWKKTQKFSFNYDNDGKQNWYSVVHWNDSLNSWTDSMYCMFFYNSSKQPVAYYVSSVNNDTARHVVYKEYYSYSNTANKLEKINKFSRNSADSLVLSSEEEYIYSLKSELDSIITINYDEDENYIWSTITEKVNYVSDTMYSIFENTSYITNPDSPAVSYDIEYQYHFSSDGKMCMQGICLLPDLITERTLYSYREEDGLPEMDLSQNIDSFADTTYKDTSRTTCSYSFQDNSVIKTATTEILSSENWIPVSRTIDTYISEEVSVPERLITADRQYKISAYLINSSYPELVISSSLKVTSVELFSINGVLLHKEKSIRYGKEINLDLSNQQVANYRGPIMAKIHLENGSNSIQRILHVR